MGHKYDCRQTSYYYWDKFYVIVKCVKLGKWRGNVEVAIKQLKNLDTDRMSGRDAIQGFEKAREEFFKECNILRILHHPHLVQVRYATYL